MLLDEFAGFFARAIGKPARKDELLVRKLLTLDLALFRLGMYTYFVQLLDELAIRGLREKFSDGCGNFRADFGNAYELLLVCRGQFFERRKMLREQLPRSFPNETYS